MRFIRHLFFSTLLLAALSPASGQTLTTEAIVWSPIKLSWDDFQEKGRNSHGADTHWMLLVKVPDTVLTAVPDSLAIPVKALFIPALSWVDPDKPKSSYLLQHEQLHFDIVEWQARELRRTISQTRFTASSWKRELDKLKRKTLAAIRRLQEQYDEESAHSRNEARQEGWQETVQEALRSLDLYADASVLLRVCNCK